MRCSWRFAVAFLLGCAAPAPDPAAASASAVPGASATQDEGTSAPVVPEGPQEISEVDVTAAPFAPTQLRFLGVALGMTHDEARRALSQSRIGVVVVEDTANPGRLYIYARTADGGQGESLLYLIWEQGDPTLARVTVFVGAAPHLHGETRMLLTEAALDPSSVVGRRLGKPDRSEITLDVPIIGLKHTTYLYAARGLLVTHQMDAQLGTSKVVFAFALPSYGLR